MWAVFSWIGCRWSGKRRGWASGAVCTSASRTFPSGSRVIIHASRPMALGTNRARRPENRANTARHRASSTKGDVGWNEPHDAEVDVAFSTLTSSVVRCEFASFYLVQKHWGQCLVQVWGGGFILLIFCYLFCFNYFTIITVLHLFCYDFRVLCAACISDSWYYCFIRW